LCRGSAALACGDEVGVRLRGRQMTGAAPESHATQQRGRRLLGQPVPLLHVVHSGSGPGVDLADVESCFRREQH
jgi:hypothetical protein